jgi:hypothetical protein
VKTATLQLLAMSLALAGPACARKAAEPDVRKDIAIVEGAAGPGVSVYGLSLGMPYERAVERAGRDVNGEFWGTQGPILRSFRADFGVKADLILGFTKGRSDRLMVYYEGEHGALERIEARIAEGLARFPHEEGQPGKHGWQIGPTLRVFLSWWVERDGRESLDLSVADFSPSRAR